jgi:flagellar biosynthesis/type III secretory pathway M-ring protein FliF/YscJ
MEFLKKSWTWIITAIGVLLGLFFYEKSRRKDAESNLLQADSDKKDAVLEQQQSDARKEAEKDIAAIEEEKKKTLTAKELEEYLRKL